MSEKIFQPNIAIHPGETLQELLESVNMSQAELAERSGLAIKTVNEIVQGKNPVTPETANKFSAIFGMSAQFWNNLQRNYDETLARLEREKNIQDEIPYLAKFTCYRELANFGCVPKTLIKEDRVKNLLNFFGVSSLGLVSKVQSVAFRKANHKNFSGESLAAWLRCGELNAQEQFKGIVPFDQEALKQSLPSLRSLTVEPVEVFQKKMVAVCAASGVMVTFVPLFENTYVNGATRWPTSSNPLVQLSLRGSYSDGFWFTFFHELGHILKHGKKDEFVEFEKRGDLDAKEQEADEFAQELLIPKREYDSFVQEQRYTTSSIEAFALKMKVDAGIVAGRLAKDEHVPVTYQQVGRLRSRLRFD